MQVGRQYAKGGCDTVRVICVQQLNPCSRFDRSSSVLLAGSLLRVWRQIQAIQMLWEREGWKMR